VYSFRVHLLTDSLLHLLCVLRNVYSLGGPITKSSQQRTHCARKHTSTRFNAFGLLLLASIYRHFNSLFAGRAAVFTAAIE